MSPRYRRFALTAFCAILTVGALTAAPAFAERTYDSQITGFTTPWGVTVDPADNVWISDPGNGGLISDYGPYPSQTLLKTVTGEGHYGPTYIRSLAVDGANNRLYVADSGPVVVHVFDSSGHFTEDISHNFGGGYLFAAADNSGGSSNSDIYVASTCCRLQKFDAEGHPLSFSGLASYISGNNISGTPSGSFGYVWNVATDNNGNIYVVDQSRKVVDEFNLSGEFVQEFTGAGAPGGFSGDLTGVAVDPTNEDVLVVDSGNNVVDEFSSTGEYLDQITGTSPSTPFGSLQGGIAVNSSGYVYAADGAKGVVDIFTPNVVLPKVTYGAVTDQTQTSGTLSASINPNEGGNVESCHFEYGETNSYGHSAQCLGVGGTEVGTIAEPIKSTAEVHVNISGLTAEKTYHYRVVAANANGTKKALDQTFTPRAVASVCTEPATSIERTAATLHGCFTGNGEETHYYFEWGATGAYGNKTAVQDAGSPTSGEGSKSYTFNLEGLQVESEYHYRFVAENAVGTTSGQDQSFTTPAAVIDVTTDPATNVGSSSLTLNGSYVGDGTETEYYFQYGNSTSYGHSTPIVKNGKGTGTQSVSAEATGLQPHFIYHFRLVAVNSLGRTYGQDETAEETPEAPTVDGLTSSELTSTTAVLNAVINPQGFATKYHFEYGTTLAYGTNTPVAEVTPPTAKTDQHVVVELTNLQSHVTYHFRLVAESKWGTATTEDHSFTFFPPSCPNDHVRQQTGANYLPDCRAYELVSPPSQGNMTPFPAVGPSSGYATEPSRLAYVGAFGDVPGIGEPSNSVGDMYVATRTNEGWVTKFIGLPGDQTYLMGSAPWSVSGQLFGPAKWQMGVIADPSLSRIVDWSDGYPSGGGNGECPCIGGSNAPYVWESTTGNLIGRFPTNLPTVSEGEEFSGQTFASRDLSHFVFSSNLVFAEGGVAGDTYDNNTLTRTTTVVSRGVNGEDKQGATVKVSAEGSHILMSSGGSLYMRVNDLVTYDVSENQLTHELANVSYVGMTAGGSKVFFTSEEHLTGEDPEHGGASLYMWNENGGHPTLTLISKGESEAPGAPGDTGSCSASWTSQCGVLPISLSPYSRLLGGVGGSCGYVPTCEPSDSSIASSNGDIYFYSPEQLDGSKGTPNQQNLYVYRNGHVQYVTTLTPGSFCTTQNAGTVCSSGPILRMDVTPDDSHMAFITASRVTSYENDGHTEMYSYDPSSGQINCDSCIPSGAAPSGNVFGSQNGLFLTNDGRTFFSTTDALVPQDTNRGEDVYEFTEGRPQLITSGTSPGNETFGFVGTQTFPGLVGVSANGTDVYFSTFEVLVGQDQNGDNLKLYDARTDGGFPFVPPTPECAAADECHGPGSSPPPAPVDDTGASLGNGGNATSISGQAKRHHRRRHTAKRHHRHNTADGKP